MHLVSWCSWLANSVERCRDATESQPAPLVVAGGAEHHYALVQLVQQLGGHMYTEQHRLLLKLQCMSMYAPVAADQSNIIAWNGRRDAVDGLCSWPISSGDWACGYVQSLYWGS